MHHIKIVSSVILLGLLLAGCATSAKNVSATYISPVIYQGFTCSQLRKEAVRIQQEVATLTGVQDKKAENDAVATGVAIVLFWPAAFFVGGDDHNTAQLGQMKGKFEALKAVSQKKRCNIRFAQSAAPVKEKKKKRERRNSYEPD